MVKTLGVSGSLACDPHSTGSSLHESSPQSACNRISNVITNNNRISNDETSNIITNNYRISNDEISNVITNNYRLSNNEMNKMIKVNKLYVHVDT